MNEVITRWYVAMPLVCGSVGAFVFMVIYGALTGQPTLVSGGSTVLALELGGVTAFYFNKKKDAE